MEGFLIELRSRLNFLPQTLTWFSTGYHLVAWICNTSGAVTTFHHCGQFHPQETLVLMSGLLPKDSWRGCFEKVLLYFRMESPISITWISRWIRACPLSMDVPLPILPSWCPKSSDSLLNGDWLFLITRYTGTWCLTYPMGKSLFYDFKFIPSSLEKVLCCRSSNVDNVRIGESRFWRLLITLITKSQLRRHE